MIHGTHTRRSLSDYQNRMCQQHIKVTGFSQSHHISAFFSRHASVCGVSKAFRVSALDRVPPTGTRRVLDIRRSSRRIYLLGLVHQGVLLDNGRRVSFQCLFCCPAAINSEATDSLVKLHSFPKVFLAPQQTVSKLGPKITIFFFSSVAGFLVNV